MHGAAKLRVVLDARMPDGVWGGVQQAAMGLAYGLSRLTGTTEEQYFFLGYKGESEWLRPLMEGDCQLVEIDKPGDRLTKARNRLSTLGFPRAARHLGRVVDRNSRKAVCALSAHVVHFTHQSAFITHKRQIYQPHDLQH